MLPPSSLPRTVQFNHKSESATSALLQIELRSQQTTSDDKDNPSENQAVAAKKRKKKLFFVLSPKRLSLSFLRPSFRSTTRSFLPLHGATGIPLRAPPASCCARAPTLARPRPDETITMVDVDAMAGSRLLLGVLSRSEKSRALCLAPSVGASSQPLAASRRLARCLRRVVFSRKSEFAPRARPAPICLIIHE